LPPTSASATLARRAPARADGLAETPMASAAARAQRLEVDEANRLELVDGKLELLELPRGTPAGFEQRDARDASHGTFNRKGGACVPS